MIENSTSDLMWLCPVETGFFTITKGDEMSRDQGLCVTPTVFMLVFACGVKILLQMSIRPLGSVQVTVRVTEAKEAKLLGKWDCVECSL